MATFTSTAQNPILHWWRDHVVASVEHVRVVEKVHAESGWGPHYLFMTLMSAGIAVLGLLLSSPAVVIGAMLISPLMGPIIGLGFAIATFDSREILLRRHQRQPACLCFARQRIDVVRREGMMVGERSL